MVSSLTAFPAHKVVDVSGLVPAARNARTHSDSQVAQIAASIREFGFTNPVLTDGKGGIVAGHGRVLAALSIGMTQVPVIELSHLTAAQRRAYMLADNKLALNAGWDDELLRLELGSLYIEGFDLSLTGFDFMEMRDIIFPIDRSAKSGDSKLSASLSYQIVIDCADEDQQAEILGDLRERGIQCRPLIL